MSVVRGVRSVLLLAGACVPAILSGCGSSSAEMSGVITVNGQPPKFSGLQITFLGANGRMVSALVGKDGSYKADAMPVGQVGVAFVYTPLDEIQRLAAKSSRKLLPGSGAAADGSHQRPVPNPIPEPLRDASTSRLTTKVEPGTKNVFNYDIKP